MLELVPDAMLIGAGDRGWVAALAARDPALPQIVSAAATFESSNPAVISIREKTLVNGETLQLVSPVAPGTATLRVSYRGLTATTPVTVFAPSAVRELAGYATGALHFPCIPGESTTFHVDGVLDTGQRVSVSSVVWRSVDPRVVSVTARDVFDLTGVVASEGVVSCAGAGSTAVEATYGTHSARFEVTLHSSAR